MKTKLTLSIEPSLVQFAHDLAQADNTSVSALVTEFLAAEKLRAEVADLPTIDDMIGSLKGYDIDDSKQGIREAYAKKYLD